MLCHLLSAILLFQWISFSGSVEAVGLVTQDKTVDVEIDNKTTIECKANAVLGDILKFYVHGTVVEIISLQQMDNPIRVSAHRNAYDITVEYGEIQGTFPERTISLTMSIDPVQRESEGAYKCEYTGAFDASSTTVIQTVGPPYDMQLSSPSTGVSLSKIPDFSASDYPFVKAVYRCEVNIDLQEHVEINVNVDSRPEATVTWRKEDYTYTDTKLDIDRQENGLDGSVFFCTADNEYGTYKVALVIEAQYKPKEPFVSEPDMYPEQGKPLFASCEFDAKPKAEIFYTRVVSEETDEWQRMESLDDKLVIDSVNLDEHVGKYKCVGLNALGQSEGYIRVHGKPAKLVIAENEVYGDSVDLTISLYSAVEVQLNLTVKNIVPNTNDRRVVNEMVKHSDVLPFIKTEHILKNLDPEVVYEITLTASNKYGCSSSSPFNVTTKSGDITRPPSVVITDNTAEASKEGNKATVTTVSILVISLCLLKSLF